LPLISSQAPGEAEAELASMSRLGIVDAIITEDSDAIVFGATTILRL
jgi:Holliday junction resolvase YEN1